MTRSRISLLLLTVLWACGGDSGTDLEDTGDDESGPTTANEFVAAAITSMEDVMFTALNIDDVSQLDDFSFAESNGLFLDALALSPSNDTASIGAAVTGIFLLEDNTAVRAVIDDWDTWLEDESFPPPFATLLGPALNAIGDPVTLPLSFSTEIAEQVARSGLMALELAEGPLLSHAPPPSLAETQTVLRDVVRPALIEAMDHLLAITNTSFTFTVTEAMQGESVIDGDPLELDYTEILVMQGVLQIALAAVDIASAYILSPSPLDAQGFVDAMTPSSAFLTLATGGAAALGNALGELQSAGTLLLAALDELESETDDQADDIIKVGPGGNDFSFNSSQEVADARDVIQDVLDALSGPTVITVLGVSFTLDARQFFINPIPDLKAVLAPYEVFTAEEVLETVVVFRWLALNLDEWLFPNPTFNGILPGMSTTSDLIDNFEIDQFFFELGLAQGYYTLITVDGVDCQANLAGGGNGCVFGSGFIFGGNISLGGGDGQPEVWINWNLSFGNRDFLGSYVVVDNLDGTYTVNMDTVRQDTGTSVSFTGTFLDDPGFTSRDEFFRARGGSSIVITSSVSGRDFVYEKQD